MHARYDATTGTLLVPSFLPFEAQRTEIAHEIAHAVADQRFGLRRFLRIASEGESRLDGDEFASARHARFERAVQPRPAAASAPIGSASR